MIQVDSSKKCTVLYGKHRTGVSTNNKISTYPTPIAVYDSIYE